MRGLDATARTLLPLRRAARPVGARLEDAGEARKVEERRERAAQQRAAHHVGGVMVVVIHA